MQTLAIPRGQTALASGHSEAGAERIRVYAERGSASYGICSTDFLEWAFRTDAYTLDVTFHPDGTWSYVSDTLLQVRGRAELPSPRSQHADEGRRTSVKSTTKYHSAENDASAGTRIQMAKGPTLITGFKLRPSRRPPICVTSGESENFGSAASPSSADVNLPRWRDPSGEFPRLSRNVGQAFTTERCAPHGREIADRVCPAAKAGRPRLSEWCPRR